MNSIPFNNPYITGKEIKYITQLLSSGKLSGDGKFSKACERWLEENLGCEKALLTHSCTAALEMTAILADIQPGDEVIMPSYTFVSTANAFVLRGATPVFVDIRKDTLNIDESKIESAISERTKAIVPVHYAGVACEMDTIMDIAEKYGLVVIEDAAQAICAEFNGRKLGSIGHMATLSFHDTKNIISGEGGALLINDPKMVRRSEIVREKGTNRSAFLKGEVDKYSWIDLGSSFLPSELIAAFLLAQLEEAKSIIDARTATWHRYHSSFKELETRGFLKRPRVPANCKHNGHIYYILLNESKDRKPLMDYLRKHNVSTTTHYVPLHSSAAGLHYSIVSGSMDISDSHSALIVRLPMWTGFKAVEYVSTLIEEFYLG